MKLLSKTGAALLLAVLCAFLFFSCIEKDLTSGLLPGIYAVLETSRGAVVVELDYKKAPLASANFIGLAEGSLEASWQRPFYDGLKFHSVQPGFIIQSGCPVGDGSGTAGYIFPDEFHSSLSHDAAGVLGMANTGTDTNSSQFYLTLDSLPALDGNYTCFGRTVSGLELLSKIKQGDSLNTVHIVRIGPDAQAFGSSQADWQQYFGRAIETASLRMKAKRNEIIAAIIQKWPELKPGLFDILTTTLAEGSGPKPEIGTEVRVHYTGMLPDGRVFDRTNPEGDPFVFKVGVGQVIEGWDVVVANMRKGEKLRVALPPEMAYGSSGVPGAIPADSFLIFEIELLDF
ncbi:MAG: peptidylprolyl isomerase [Spirochaetes bacterium]|nr:peptidylprolyl isomerase [Spirochaetota bacterium]